MGKINTNYIFSKMKNIMDKVQVVKNKKQKNLQTLKVRSKKMTQKNSKLNLKTRDFEIWTLHACLGPLAFPWKTHVTIFGHPAGGSIV